jgi:hypothetical protein
MSRRLLLLLIAVLLCSLFPAHTPPVAADSSAPPPLPRGCGRGQNDDYASALCCVSGYVYLNGQPVEHAEVTLSLGDQQVTVQTRRDYAASEPYYFARLDTRDWLDARPGDEITITASAQGQQKTRTFIAYEGGQQEDLVLPHVALDATWSSGEMLTPRFHRTAMAYDAARGELLLFGGLAYVDYQPVLRNTTWRWDGRSWTRLAPRLSPEPRVDHVMAYDAAREQVVLYGGKDADENRFSDTWTWDGEIWQRRQTETAPEFSNVPVMAYDSASQRVLLVGAAADGSDLLVTWAWDGTDWRQLPAAQSPPARNSFGLAYDTEHERLILFGGLRGNVLQQDTWQYDGATWSRRHPLSAPSARSGHTMRYDPERRQILLAGGVDNGGAPLEDTWGWNGENWQELRLDLPPRAGAMLSYDSQRRTMILVGGYSDADAHDYPHETWELDAIDWNQRAPMVSPSVISSWKYNIVYDAKRKRAVAFDYNYQTWEWDGIGWTKRQVSSKPVGIRTPTMVYDAAHDYVLAFGGLKPDGSRSTETWIWQDRAWTKLEPEHSPPGRSQHVMAYDAARERVVLYGGNYDNHASSMYDTWEWDGTDWHEVTPATSPEITYYRMTMAYDATSQHVMLVDFTYSHSTKTWLWDGTDWIEYSPAHPPECGYPGVCDQFVYDFARQRLLLLYRENGDTNTWSKLWEWDGTDWTEHDLNNGPPRRSDYGLTSIPDRQQIILFGGKDTDGNLGDTWLWDGNTWQEQFDDTAVPVQLTAAAMAYAGDGYSLLFGGRDRFGGLSDRTFRWQGNRWLRLAPATTPPARQSHQMAGSADNNRLLLFGGIASDSSFLGDTWLWDGDDWQAQNPASAPAARADAGLSYDAARDVWVLFGGQNSSYLNDTWEFDGRTWHQISLSTVPPARSGASLSYDANRGVLVLFGGRSSYGLHQDVWEYDGMAWHEVTPPHSISARAGHVAAYDPSRAVIVVAGGLGDAGVLADTWEWNGSFWRERMAATPITARQRMAAAYDTYRGELVTFGGEDASGTLFDLTQLHRASGSLAEPTPIATINRMLPRDARQGSETITFAGSGGDSDASDVIIAHRWSYLDAQGQPVVFSNAASFSKPAADFPRGIHTVRLEVQDNEGSWSPPVEETLIIRDADGSTGANTNTWTLLIYAAADNNLNTWMGSNPDLNGMLYRLEHAGASERVQVGILYDGPTANDTRRYMLNEHGDWYQQAQPEARMDDMATLRDFIDWGYTTFPDSDHYVLALVDHANGVVGFAEDRSSPAPDGKPFLTPFELRTALEQGTANGARKLDVLYYDGCSFGLYETAAIAEGMAHYVVASPTTAWGVFAYEEYRAMASKAENPRDFATGAAAIYAERVSSDNRAYTVSVFDMAQFPRLDAAVSEFGDQLHTYVGGDRSKRVGELRELRNFAQKYDSGGLRPIELDTEDAYVDIVDLAEQVRANIDDRDVDTAASSLIDAVKGNSAGAIPPFVISESHASSSYRAYDPDGSRTITVEVNLDFAHGIGIFYPPRAAAESNSAYQAYVQHQLFHITRDNGWTRFIGSALPPQSAGSTALPNDSLISPLLPEPEPEIELEPEPEPDPEPVQPHQLFLPLIRQGS